MSDETRTPIERIYNAAYRLPFIGGTIPPAPPASEADEADWLAEFAGFMESVRTRYAEVATDYADVRAELAQYRTDQLATRRYLGLDQPAPRARKGGS